jgi:hypothetical protein
MQKVRKEPTPNDLMKLEIAKELGFEERILRDGWKSLSSKESGKIGGLMTKRKREMKEAS